MMGDKKETSQVAGTTKEVEKDTISINCKNFTDKILEKEIKSTNLDRYLQ